MVAYFKRQNLMLMIAGAALALLLALPWMIGNLPKMTSWIRGFALAFPLFVGIVIGRLLASFWANRKLRQIDALLYQQTDPEAFISIFSPMVEKVPHNIIEFVNGRVKIAYACEALGRFEQGLQALEDVTPQELKLHSLAATSLTINQKTRLFLLKEDVQAAENYLEDLRKLQTTAEGRVPVLAANLKECIRLNETWIDILQGNSGEPDYIREEITLAKNDIHRGEMKLLLAKSCENSGNPEEALLLLKETAAGKDCLFSTKKAKELLQA